MEYSESWDGKLLSEVQAYIKQEIAKSLQDVNVSKSNNDVTLTFKRGGDGASRSVTFNTSDSETTGYTQSLVINLSSRYVKKGDSLKVNYAYSNYYNGSELGTSANLKFEVRNSEGTTVYTTTVASVYGSSSFTVPASDEFTEGSYTVVGTATLSTDEGDKDYTARSSFQVSTISLSYPSTFNLGSFLNWSSTTLTIPYIYTGNNDATLHLYIDGEEVSTYTAKSSNSGTQTSLTYTISGMAADTIHTVQMVAEQVFTDTSGSDSSMFSNSLIFDFCYNRSDNKVGVMLDSPSSDIISSPSTSLDFKIAQYEYSSITYAAVGTTDTDDKKISVSIRNNNTLITTLAVTPNTNQEYSFNTKETDSFTLKLQAKNGNTRLINVNVEANQYGVTVSDGAVIDISANNRLNSEPTTTRNKWTFSDSSGNSYTATLNDFDFSTNGWIDNALLVSDGANLTIPYAPFSKFWDSNGNFLLGSDAPTASQVEGMTIELTFKVKQLIDKDDFLIKCLNSSNKAGFYLKPSEMGILTNSATGDATNNKWYSGSYISTYLGEDQYMKVQFVVRTYTGTVSPYVGTKTVLLMLYVNGVLTAITPLETVNNTLNTFDKDAQIEISSDAGSFYFYGMRVYDRPLTYKECLNNYIADLTDGTEIVEIASRNAITDAKGNISSSVLRSMGKSVLIVTLAAEEGEATSNTELNYATKEQFLDPLAKKKANFVAKKVRFYHNGGDDFDFETSECLFQVQGTSSTSYSRKNYDIFFTGQKDITATFNSEVGKNAIDGGGWNNSDHTYKMSEEDLPVPVVCCKADYVDSSNLHNTVITDFVNDSLLSMGITTPAQQYNDKIRVGINGYPIDIFVKTEGKDDEEYIGKYNMNNEKKDSHNVFGFNGNTNAGEAICIEFLTNNYPGTLFSVPSGTDSDNFWYKEDTKDANVAAGQLEFRYPSSWNWKEDGFSESRVNIIRRVWDFVYDCHVARFGNGNDIAEDTTNTDFKDNVSRYFNINNLCMWYLYTEFFLMVDQRSKNMMLASWGATENSGIWYFLPYDSDTALGVINSGWLVLPYNSDENTINPMITTEYAYQGHNSYLWDLVRDQLQTELKTLADTFRNKYSITQILNMFTNYQNNWCEMQYNFDQETKYINPLVHISDSPANSGISQFVQGTREAHRKYLITNRFNLLDGKYVTTPYYTTVWQITADKPTDVDENGKLLEGATTKSIKAVMAETFALLLTQNNKWTSPTIYPATLHEADDSTISMPVLVAIGTSDPMQLCGFQYCSKIDFSEICRYFSQDFLVPAGYTKLKKLTMDCGENKNTIINSINVKNAISMRELTIKGFDNIGAIDLTGMNKLERVEIDCGSALTDESHENGANITLPKNIKNLIFANFYKYNYAIPASVWDGINSYYEQTNRTIVVGELTSASDSYFIKGKDSTQIYVSGQYFVQVMDIDILYNGANIAGIFSGNNLVNSNPGLLKRLIYSKFDTNLYALCFMEGIFYNCQNLEYVNTDYWYYGEGISTNEYQYTNMFNRCSSLKRIDLTFMHGYANPSYNTIERDGVMFYNCSSLEYIRMGEAQFNNATMKKGNQFYVFKQSTNWLPETFTQLAEDLPDVNDTIKGTDYAKIIVGSTNYANFTMIPQTVRDAISEKGWTLAVS